MNTSVNRLKMVLKNTPEQVVYEMIMYAEEQKRISPERDYWQGRTDMGRIVFAILFDSDMAAIVSTSQSFDTFSQYDRNLLDAIDENSCDNEKN